MAEELGRCTRGGNPQCVQADHFASVRVVDERLGFPTPAQHVPHRGGNGEHCRRGINGVAALLEHHGARGGALWFARYGHPVLAQQHRAGGLLGE